MEIVVREGMYYSQRDEAAFFNRFYEMECIRRVVGLPDGLHIQFIRPPNNAQLRELIALLRRYDLDMAPLSALRTARNAKWFADPEMFWYERVFGVRKRPRAKKRA